MTKPSAALVIGASRGLGLALVEEWCGRGWRVTATARGHSDQLATLATRFPGSLETEAVDINSADSVQSLQQRLSDHHFDVLFVNAGIARSIESTPVDVDETDFLDMMLTNALAPVRTIELLRNLVLDRGVLAVMSSELGSIAQNTNSRWQLYSASKAALNMLMKGYATRHPDDTRALLLVAPGWVRTELGGDDASLSTGESIPLVVDTIDANRGKPGLRYLDRFNKSLPW
jgi:NAD(P)-dependent dehydrogenase (short-subunit alcohol dehydrogenase family)